MGQVIAQRYEVQDELGKGGVGTVFRGKDTHTQQTVAIKQLKPELTTPDLIERFVREGAALRALNHPNIVNILDEVEESGQNYLIIEYLPGGDLNTQLKMGKLPVERCVKLAIEIADALTRAHHLNIIHRDLKPANVLLAADGTPRLTDFGVAHISEKERVTDTDTIVGTVDYLSPETLNGEGIDSRTDIWAFGVMLFEMLAGERPFTGTTLTEIITAILTHPAPDLETLRPSAPIALVDLIYRMLEKDCSARIHSMRYVGAELEDILHGGSTHTLPETRFATPTPDMLHRPKHNLPAQTTPFVGREAELSELAKLLPDPKIRLVTILAPGGMGKTRLSIELAHRVRTNYADGAFFVDLTQITSAQQLPALLARVLAYPPATQEDTLESKLLTFLSDKSMLLLFDNFEHVLEAMNFVSQIVQQAQQIQILVTSRVRLNLLVETGYQIHGLDYPSTGQVEALSHNASVQLFLQTMHRIQPMVEPDVHIIAKICRKLSGMPLAILLAATWTDTLTLDELMAELELDLLDTNFHDIPDRQRSMRYILEQTWQMLSEAERDAIMLLSALQGTFSRDAAQEIAGVTLKMLRRLYERALVQRQTNTGRYTLHEVLRLYAAEHLEASGKRNYLKDLHLAYFSGLARHQRRQMLCVQQAPQSIQADTTQDRLTPREQEVLYYMAQGYSNSDIADALLITISTVKAHANRIFSKLNVRSRTQAVVHARDIGLIM